MKKLLYTIITIYLIQFSCFGQELKPKKVKTLEYIEEYTILSVNKKIKQGDYKKYRIDGSQIWTGKFDNNSKVGEWSYYENGEIEQSYNYDEKKLTFQRKPMSPFVVLMESQIKITNVDTPPGYIGSKIGLTEEINRVLKYPTEARRMGVEGPVTVAIWIRSDGSLGEIELMNGTMKECNEDLISAIKKIPNNWFAATVGVTKVDSKLIIVADYNLNYISEHAAITVR